MSVDSIFLKMKKKSFTCMSVMVILASLLMVGCGDSGQSTKNILQANTAVRKFNRDVTLHGEVRNEKGPVSSGVISVADDKGHILATVQTEDNGRYAVDIPSGTALPLILTVTTAGGKDKSEELQVVVIEPALTQYDINMLTTTIAKKARAMGGYSYNNMKQAAMSSSSVPDANKTTGGFKGDPTKQYGGWH